MPLAFIFMQPFLLLWQRPIVPRQWLVHSISFTMKGRALSSVEDSCLSWFVFCSELTFYSLQIGPALRMVRATEQENPDQRQNLSLQFDY